MKRIGLGVFETAEPNLGGTITRTGGDGSGAEQRELSHWVAVARLLDDAGFDFLFFAGSRFAWPSVGDELAAPLVAAGFGASIDASYLLPALAAVTERIGLVVTSSTGTDHPAATVRTFSTLDHLTGGRVGWNIVTGAFADTQAAVLGQTRMVPHDERYAMAGEYLDVALRCWEGAWADGAPDDGAAARDGQAAPNAHDPTARVDASRARRVVHEGEHYRTSGYHLSPPGPQRTPLLFQAGTSEAGREFAATYAECVFVQGTTVAGTAAHVVDIRARAAAHGRDPAAVKVFVGATVVTAATAQGAAEQRAAFEALQSDVVAAAWYAGITGIDLLALDPQRSLEQVFEGPGAAGRGQLGRSNVERFLPADGSPAPTARQVLDQLKHRGTRGFAITGDGAGVADAVEELVDATDLDGIMLEPTAGAASLHAFVDHVVPELERRGRRGEAAGSTFRERMTGAGPHLDSAHRGAGMRVR